MMVIAQGKSNLASPPSGQSIHMCERNYCTTAPIIIDCQQLQSTQGSRSGTWVKASLEPGERVTSTGLDDPRCCIFVAGLRKSRT